VHLRALDWATKAAKVFPVSLLTSNQVNPVIISSDEVNDEVDKSEAIRKTTFTELSRLAEEIKRLAFTFT
jgi:hypothetical protein